MNKNGQLGDDAIALTHIILIYDYCCFSLASSGYVTKINYVIAQLASDLSQITMLGITLHWLSKAISSTIWQTNRLLWKIANRNRWCTSVYLLKMVDLSTFLCKRLPEGISWYIYIGNGSMSRAPNSAP